MVRAYMTLAVDSWYFSCLSTQFPYNHSVMYQYRASTDPMLAASAQYWPCTGTQWNVYRVISSMKMSQD